MNLRFTIMLGLIVSGSFLCAMVDELRMRQVKFKMPDIATAIEQKLFTAARDGAIEDMRNALNQGANINVCDYYGRTAIYWATVYGHIAIVRELIARGANINNRAGLYTPLHAAAEYSRIDIAQLLLESGANVNARVNEVTRIDIQRDTGIDITALHLAVREGYEDMTVLLIRHHANVNADGNILGTPLQVAAKEGLRNIVTLLVENHADVNFYSLNWNGTPVSIAEHHGHHDIVQFLRNHGGIAEMKGVCLLM